MQMSVAETILFIVTGQIRTITNKETTIYSMYVTSERTIFNLNKYLGKVSPIEISLQK